MPSSDRSAHLDLSRALDWSEIYRRLADDHTDSLAWVGLETWISLWAKKALAQLGPPAVEDAIADTCASVVLGFDKARGPGTFAGFAYGHFLNVRQRLLRQRLAPVVPLDTVEVAESAAEGPAPDELALLQQCLAELAERERRAVELRYFEDAPTEQIARALGVTLGNARRIVFNGLAHLRACARRAWPRGR
jgi:RNA polymerase sigma factor (sigma-70 family)